MQGCQSRIAEIDDDIGELVKDNNYITNGGCLNFQLKKKDSRQRAVSLYIYIYGGNSIFRALLGSVYLRVTFNLLHTLLGSLHLRVIFNLLHTLLGSVYLRVIFNLFYTLLGSVYLRVVSIVPIPSWVVYT